jgi:hypothetical protein
VIVFCCFPKKGQEEELLAQYHADDSPAKAARAR